MEKYIRNGKKITLNRIENQCDRNFGMFYFKDEDGDILIFKTRWKATKFLKENGYTKIS